MKPTAAFVVLLLVAAIVAIWMWGKPELMKVKHDPNHVPVTEFETLLLPDSAAREFCAGYPGCIKFSGDRYYLIYNGNKTVYEHELEHLAYGFEHIE